MPPAIPQPSMVTRFRTTSVRVLTLFLIFILCGGSAFAYSVLTHEEIIDLLWLDEIKPLLLNRFPGLTEGQVKEAHAYAYGGAVIQDLGYYPFGNVEFSELVHYVRSGDFVRELLKESRDANEYAFALGALAHYASDVAGHPAVNEVVAIEYPKLRARYGNSVRYAQGKVEHIRTEFGFDATQVAKKRYAPEDYHDLIGFKVSKPLLERVFPVIYGVELKEVLTHEDLAIESYRFSVGQVIPKMTQVALQVHGEDMARETPDFARDKFLYRLKRADYEKEWGKDYEKPGIGTCILSFIVRITPKIGPFKALAFVKPTAQTEDLYFKSINTAVDQYKALLEETRMKLPALPNLDFDTGNPTKATEYTLTDDSYASLLMQLADRKFDLMTAELKENILNFYSDLSAPFDTKKNKNEWKKVLAALDQLKLATPASPIRIPAGVLPPH